MSEIGIGYTLATGRLYCSFSSFQEFAEKLLDRPLMTHEFAVDGLWRELREAFESQTADLEEAIS